MFFIYFFRFVFGYVRVSFSGDFCERILNLAAQRRATLWGIKKCEDGSLHANISVKNFKEIRKIRSKSRIKVKIINKSGLPFIIKKHSNRIGFVAGLIIFFLIINFLSGFIWKIDVVGNDKISSEVIIKACNELDVFEGVKRKKIDPSVAKEKLLIKLNGLAWASFNIEGCRLTVNVSEVKNVAAEKEMPSNLLAKFDGVIKHIDVKKGNCLIKVGEAVVKDDVLVSGVQEFKESGVVKKVRSKAEIIAQTKRTFKVKVDKTQRKNVVGGKEIKKSVLSFFGLKIPLFFGKTKTPFAEKTTEKRLKLFGENLPISITEKTFCPLKEIEIKLSSDDAMILAEKTIENTINNCGFLNCNLIDTNFSETEDLLFLSKTYECEENIVYEVFIEENILQ